MLFPLVGASLILGKIKDVKVDQLVGPALDAYRVTESRLVVNTYIGLAVSLALVAAVVWANRNRLKGERHEESSIAASFALLSRPRFGFGALCIFLYVGAEVSIGSIIVNYLSQPSVMGIDHEAAGGQIWKYWFGAMVGRFLGSALLRLVSPARTLAACAAGAIALLAISTHTSGLVAAYSLLAIGLMNSIMFPTIFTLACEGLGKRAADGSGIINVAIFGGAVVPLATGALADATGSLTMALVLPALCYGVIVAFGLFAVRPVEPIAG